jgi:hypothetical protein
MIRCLSLSEGTWVRAGLLSLLGLSINASQRYTSVVDAPGSATVERAIDGS